MRKFWKVICITKQCSLSDLSLLSVFWEEQKGQALAVLGKQDKTVKPQIPPDLKWFSHEKLCCIMYCRWEFWNQLFEMWKYRFEIRVIIKPGYSSVFYYLELCRSCLFICVLCVVSCSGCPVCEWQFSACFLLAPSPTTADRKSNA